MPQHPHILENPPKRQPISGTKTYKVSQQTLVSGIDKPIDTTLTYNLEIHFTDHFLYLKKSNKIIDKKPINTKINELYLKAEQPLDSIETKRNEQGQIKQLYKYQKIVKQWEHTKTLINEEFTGEPVNQLIAQFDKKYYNIENLIQSLNNNIVIQTFYRSFIDDYLIYYGKNTTSFTNTAIINNTPLPFSGKKTLGLQNNKLELNSNAHLNKELVDASLLKKYFQNKIKNFTLDLLEINIKDHTLLNYNSLWIAQSTVTKTIQAGNYKKQIILTLENV